jgi:hypothetical protein
MGRDDDDGPCMRIFHKHRTRAGVQNARARPVTSSAEADNGMAAHTARPSQEPHLRVRAPVGGGARHARTTPQER